MAIELEKIKAWDGQSGTGADARGVIDRNFEKVKDELEAVDAKFSDVEDEIVQLAVENNAVSSAIGGLNQVSGEIKNGYYLISLDGSMSWADGSRWTEIVPIVAGKKYFATARVLGTTTALAVYLDSNETPISFETRGASPYTDYKLKELSVPTNASYIAVCSLNSNILSVFSTSDINTQISSLDEFKTKISNKDIYPDGVPLPGNVYTDIDGNGKYYVRVLSGALTFVESEVHAVKVIDARAFSGKTVYVDTNLAGPFSAPAVVLCRANGDAVNWYKFDSPQVLNKTPFVIPLNVSTIYVPYRTDLINDCGIFSISDAVKTDLLKKDFRYTNLNYRTISDVTSNDGYISKNKVLKIDLSNCDGILHVAMKYKIRQDVNIGIDKEIDFMKLVNPSTGDYLRAFIYSGETSLFQAREKEDNENTPLTTYPMPYYNSGFGWFTNSALTDEGYRSYRFQPRNYKYLKPLTGKDSFRIWYKGLLKNTEKNVDDADVQADLSSKNWTVTISDTAIIFKLNDSVIKSYDYAIYPTVREIYDAIEEDTKPGGLLQDLELDYYIIGTDDTNGVDGSSYPSNSLVKCTDIPLISVYPKNPDSPSSTATRYDAFPFYVPFAKDDSIHTFEMLFDIIRGKALITFDGQHEYWYEYDGKAFTGAPTLAGLQRMITNDCVLNVGNTDYIDIEEIHIQKGGYQDVEVNMDWGRFASNLHPYIVGIGGHGLFKGKELPGSALPTGYDDEPVTAENPYPIIPANMRPPEGYKGDDVVPIALSNPSGKIEKYIAKLHKYGFKPITLLDLADWFEGKTELPRKCYFIQFDDARTYIYADLYLRSMFQRIGVKPSFTCALSNYVDYEPWVSMYNDTIGHRQILMKRLSHMKSEGWICTMHGEDEPMFQGRDSKDTYGVIVRSIEMGEYLNVHSDLYTWAASKHTPNAIKAFEHTGIRMALRSSGRFPALANTVCCVARGYLEDMRNIALERMFRF